MHPEAPTYSALRTRAEFVQPPQCLSGMLGRDDQTIASGCTDRFGRGCSFQLADWRPRGSGERGRRVVDAAASDRSRDIGAKWRFLEGGVPSHALFQVDNVTMANLLRGDRPSGGAEVLP
jgi:hypothetical protein